MTVLSHMSGKEANDAVDKDKQWGKKMSMVT